MNKILLYSLLFIAIIGVFAIFLNDNPNIPVTSNAESTVKTEKGTSQIISLQTEKFETELKEVDGVKYIVPLGNIRHVCPLDCISSIENPVFEKASEANLRNDETVIGIDYNGIEKAYPFSRFREVINDAAGDEPILITWCPLCGTAIAFKRKIDGKEVEFGVSGKLLNSDLILYERKDFTLIQQINGKSIVGNILHEDLERIPSDTVRWKDWIKMHPDTLVLVSGDQTRSTGKLLPYEDTIRSIRDTKTVKTDNRLESHEFIVGIEIKGVIRAYPLRKIRDLNIINDKIEGINIVILNIPGTDFVRILKSEVDGKILDLELRNENFYDKISGTTWDFDGFGIDGVNKGKILEKIDFVRSFWFGWVAFHPDTELYSG